MAGVLACALHPAPVISADWSLTGQLSQRLQIDTNRELDNPSEGLSVDSRTNLGLNLTGTTKRSQFTVGAGVAATVFAGPGASDNEPFRIDPSQISIGYTHLGKDYTITQNGSLDVQPTTDTQIDDTGVSNTNTTQLSVSYGADLALLIDERSLINLALSAAVIDFAKDTPGLTSTRTLGISTIWQHQLNRTSTFSASVGLRQFMADNAAETRSQTIDLSLALSHQRTSRHSFGLNGGISIVRTSEQQASSGKNSELTASGTGGASFDYVLGNLNTNLALSQSVDPSSTGALQGFSRLSGRLNHAINSSENLSLSLSLSRRAPLMGSDGDTLHALSFGPTYSIALTPETSLSLSYAFNISHDSIDGTASGHRLSLTLGKSLSLLP